MNFEFPPRLVEVASSIRSRLEAGAVEILGRLSPADRKALAPILSRHKARRDARKPEKAAKPVAPAAPAPAEAPVRS